MKSGGLVLYNSLARRKERFKSRSKKVGVYVCGITPDAPMHVGHAFVFTFFDVLLRYLRHLGFSATYVQNITDIDDDILARSAAKGADWKSFGQKHTREFLENMRWLNNKRPDVQPRATRHIADMIKIIRVLLKKGFAYAKNGSVYFFVAKDKEYGKLSGLSKKSMLKIANERGNNPLDPNKRNPLDFVLWQAGKPGLPAQAGEPSWPSLWGRGRPGWHIECSAMAMRYLGTTIDIQGGGSDLLFPHHESSIAQSETATGKQYARFWLHVGMVRYKKAKMAKSLGNVVAAADMRKKYSANAFRLFLLSHHYRSSFEFKEQRIAEAQKLWGLFEKALRTASQGSGSFNVSLFKERFYSAMNDDMDTKKALYALQGLALAIGKRGKAKNTREAQAFLKVALSVLGFTMKT